MNRFAMRAAGCFAVLAAALVPIASRRCEAASVSLSINDIMLDHRVNCDAPIQALNLGDLSVSVSNSGGSVGMSAAFTVDPAISGDPSAIWDCLNLHWVQIITADACPASVAGVAAGTAGLPFPVVDTPPNGWDYIYKDLDMPADGIQADERVATNVDSADLVDDANDTLPWYHTTAEEAGAAGSGNEMGDLGAFVDCVSYGIKDAPGFCPSGGITAFTTFLVAVPTMTCAEHADCLALNDMLVLAGFDWTWTSTDMDLSVAATSLGATSIDSALSNTGFTGGWEAFDVGTICCPEPSSYVLMSLAMLFGGYWRSKQRRPKGGAAA